MTTPINLLTDEQIVALTAEEIQRYKDLSAAENGIVLPGPQPPIFDEQPAQPDTILYEVAGLAFLDRDDAVEVRDFLAARRAKMSDRKYEYSVSYSDYYVAAYEADIAITEQPTFTLDAFNAERARLADYKQRKEESNRARSEWDKNDNAYSKNNQWINDLVSDARGRISSRAENQRRFDEYLELADGNADRAWTFFTKADLVIEGFIPEGAPLAASLPNE